MLYWMSAYRRRGWNFALQHAVDEAIALGKPLVILEALRVDYPHASDRLHRFVLDGMRANRAAFADAPVHYHAYVEPKVGAGRGLLRALAERAALVVADDWPCYFLPRMIEAAAEGVDCRMVAVDSYGLVPLAATPKAFARAHDFRRWLQRHALPHVLTPPRTDPLAPLARAELPRIDLPEELERRWPAASDRRLERGSPLDVLPIDHAVPPVGLEGGTPAARGLLEAFVGEPLRHYGAERRRLGRTSRLSAHLHFGHLSPHEVFDAVAEHEDWSPEDVTPDVRGAKEGYWGMSPTAEAFLDQLVTWRELGGNFTSRVAGYDTYDTLPGWALETLRAHAGDPRPYVYSREELEAARTHDELWNATQLQLVREGRIENYLRMLWGKKVLHWSASPEEAFETLVELNDRYALDGRDPNSYSSISWIFGRFDRAWGPEREVFGKVRYMSSANTRRKLRLTEYLGSASASAWGE